MLGDPNSATAQGEVFSREPRIRWLFASLLMLSTFAIGVAGFGLAGFGPCTATNPKALFFSSALSVAVICGSLRALTQRQRRIRLRTLPFYLVLVVAVLFAALQFFLLLLSQ